MEDEVILSPTLPLSSSHSPQLKTLPSPQLALPEYCAVTGYVK